MSSKNNNKLNIPEARAAMDKFKMESAQEFAVPGTYWVHHHSNDCFICNTFFWPDTYDKVQEPEQHMLLRFLTSRFTVPNRQTYPL